MALKKKPIHLNINFNFSDDSDDDDDKDKASTNAETKHILQELKGEINSQGNLTEYLQLAADGTIIAGDYLSRCELPLLSEDLGPPITESTLLADSTMYVTALDNSLDQSQSHIVSEDKHCFVSRDKITSKLFDGKHVVLNKREKNAEIDKENMRLVTKAAKIRSSLLKLSKNPSISHKNGLEVNHIKDTPLKAKKMCNKHRLFVYDAPLASKLTENIETRFNSVTALPAKVSVKQVDSSNISYEDEEAAHKHHELISESFVEVQDMSVQTSLPIEGLSDSKGSKDYELQNIDSDCGNAIQYSSVLKSESDSIKKPGTHVHTIDDTQNDTQAAEVSSYEVQDISIQTSFVEEPFHIDSMSSLQDSFKEQNTQALLKEPLHYENHNFHSVKITPDKIKAENLCLGNTSIQSMAESSETELFETDYEEMCDKIQSCAITSSLRCGEAKLEPDSFRTCYSIMHEHQITNSGNVQFKLNSPALGFEACRDGKVNFTSKERKLASNNQFDLSSNNDDDDNKCDVLAAASGSEDEGINNFNSGDSDSVVDKVGESFLGDSETDDDDVWYAREITPKSDHVAENIKGMAVCSDLDTSIVGQSCEGRLLDSNSATDYKTRLTETSSPTEKGCANERDLKANNFKTGGQNSVNFNSIQQKKLLYPSDDDDDDSDFENFIRTQKSSLKPQKPSKEETSLDSFIVDDSLETEEEDSADEDDELLDSKTTNEQDELRSGKRYPLRCADRFSTHNQYGDSVSETSDSDLDGVTRDSPRQTNGKTRSAAVLLDLSSDDDFLQGKSSSSERNTKTPSKWQVTKVDSCGDILELKPGMCLPKTPGKNASVSPKKSNLSTSSEGADDFTSRGPENLLFKTPRNVEQWKRPLKTPAPRHLSREDFKTPSNTRGSVLQATTAPRPCGDNGLKDDIFFLKSLTADIPDYTRHVDAVRFIKGFQKNKAELVQKLFKIFNSTIFEDKLPTNLELEWSVRYRKTAGTFYYKGRPDNFVCKVTLSAKVCDSPERVRDTLAHEFCHAAVKLINGASESHGPYWKSWARKINRAYSFMPVIARCHNYFIATKYTYQCVNCKYRIGRHSKSLDTDTKVCGHCRGKFVLYLTRELNSSSEGSTTPATPQTPRTPNKFALFVKECYSQVKKREDKLKHGDIMKILSQEFAEKNKICETMN